jgi:alkylhydroperoxidase family enzyme
MESRRHKRMMHLAIRGSGHAADPTQKHEVKIQATMSRITPISANGAEVDLKQKPENRRLTLDRAPRFLQVMAQSRAALRAYILAEAALVRGQLTRRQREQVARVVAEIDGSSSRLSNTSNAASESGFMPEDLESPHNAAAADPRSETLLHFTQAVVLQRGEVDDEEFQALVKAGFSYEQIIEIVANIALNIFATFFNNVARTGVGDFPPLRRGLEMPRFRILKSPIQPPVLKAGLRRPIPKEKQHL